MNSDQQKVLLIGCVLVALMILVPPWEYFDNDSSGRSPAGYHFILMRPALKSPMEMFGVERLRVPNQVSAEVDIFRLAFQLLVAVPIIAGLVTLFADRLTVVKTVFGFILIGVGLFVLNFALWLRHSIA